MNRLLTGLLLSTTLLTGCTETTTTEFDLLVAPNQPSASQCAVLKVSECLLTKTISGRYPTNWQVHFPIQGFTYEPGFLYTLTMTQTFTTAFLGDPAPAMDTLKQVKSKVPSSETKQPGDS